MVLVTRARCALRASTGAVGSYVSGPFGTQYICRWGQYLIAVNWEANEAILTLPPDMSTGNAVDLVSGAAYDLTQTMTVPIPAQGGVMLYRLAEAAQGAL